jgi:hypothetical protein
VAEDVHESTTVHYADLRIDLLYINEVMEQEVTHRLGLIV